MNFSFMESRASQMASEAPRLTIGIPTWNREAILRVQLDALMPHLREDVELVVCDNGSTDGTWQLLHDFVRSTPFRVRCMRNAVNLGADVNYLRVLEFASGEWVWMVGDDDRIDFQLIRPFLKIIETSPADILLLLDDDKAAGIDTEYVIPSRFFENKYDEVGMQVLQVGRIICKTEPIRPLLRNVYGEGVGTLHSYSGLYGPVIMKNGVVVISTQLLSTRLVDPPRWNLLTGSLGAWKSSLRMYGNRGDVANKREVRLRQRNLLYIAAGQLILDRPLKSDEVAQMYARFNVRGKLILFALQSAFKINRSLTLLAIGAVKPALIPKIKANAARESIDY